MQTLEAPTLEVGIHRDIPNAVYHATAPISRSRLWKILGHTPYYADKNPQPDAAAHFIVGEAVHCSILEPESFYRRYVTYAGRRDKRTKEYKEFLKQHPGKEVLSESEAHSIRSILNRLRGSETGNWAFKSGEPEVSMVWRDAETDLLLKARPDWVDFERDLIIDVKSTKDIDTWGLKHSIRKFGYHFQDHHYRSGYHALTGRWPRFVFLFLGKGPKVFEFRWEVLSQSDCQKAAEDHAESLAAWKNCTEAGEWPSYPDRVETLEPIFRNDYA